MTEVRYGDQPPGNPEVKYAGVPDATHEDDAAAGSSEPAPDVPSDPGQDDDGGA